MTHTNATKFDFTSLVIVLAYALIIVVMVYKHSWEFKTTIQSMTWEQPVLSTNQSLISPDNHRIRFDSVEKAFSEVQFDSKGNLVLNTNTANALEAAFSLIPINANEAEIQRFKFLINRIHPYNESQALADLTLSYRDYIQAKYEFDKQQPRNKSLKQAENALQYEIKLKEKIFGKQVTQALFGNKHLIARYIIERRKVIADKNLSDIQKEAKLAKLKQSLKNADS